MKDFIKSLTPDGIVFAVIMIMFMIIHLLFLITI